MKGDKIATVITAVDGDGDIRVKWADSSMSGWIKAHTVAPILGTYVNLMSSGEDIPEGTTGTVVAFKDGRSVNDEGRVTVQFPKRTKKLRQGRLKVVEREGSGSFRIAMRIGQERARCGSGRICEDDQLLTRGLCPRVERLVQEAIKLGQEDATALGLSLIHI